MNNIITIDFETYYDKDYSLTKLPTAQYIWDDRFEIIGVAISVGHQEPVWCSGEDSLSEYLSEIDWDTTTVIAHNALFDGAILEWRLGIKPRDYFCTMQGARPFIVPFVPQQKSSLELLANHCGFGSKLEDVKTAKGKRLVDFSPSELESYAEYCRQDVRLTSKLALELLPRYPPDERKFLDLTLKKFIRPRPGFVLDNEMIRKEQAFLQLRKSGHLQRCGISEPTQLRSDVTFARLLWEAGLPRLEIPIKVSPTTQRQTYAFAKSDKAFIALKQHPNEKVRHLVEARLAIKSSIEESRLERFSAVASAVPNHVLPVPLLYYGAHTGRLSGLDKLNLQNLKKDSPLRAALRAPKGNVVVSGDWSAIEARVLATLAKEQGLIEAFRSGRDVYREFGALIYDMPGEELTDQQRFISKMAVLGLGYGMGTPTFKVALESAGVEIEEFLVHRIVETYRSTFSQITKLWGVAKRQWIPALMGVFQEVKYGPIKVSKGEIILPNNMPIYYPRIRIEPLSNSIVYKEKQYIHGAKLVENVCQALARIVMSTAELVLADHNIYAALSVHDELNFIVPDRHVDRFEDLLYAALSMGVPWMPDLPLKGEVKSGKTYAECK